MIDDWEVIICLCFNFLHRQYLSIVFQRALAFAIERKIVLASDACCRPPIIIKSYDLYASEIRGAVSEIASYCERD
jgi:hypothetical protein